MNWRLNPGAVSSNSKAVWQAKSANADFVAKSRSETANSPRVAKDTKEWDVGLRPTAYGKWRLPRNWALQIYMITAFSLRHPGAVFASAVPIRVRHSAVLCAVIYLVGVA